ncbi:MAG: hypothetical protein WBC87_19150, partial [Pseudolabrys sp.]
HEQVLAFLSSHLCCPFSVNSVPSSERGPLALDQVTFVVEMARHPRGNCSSRRQTPGVWRLYGFR